MQRAQGIAKSLRAASGIQNAARPAIVGESQVSDGFINRFGDRHASRQILQQRMKSVSNIQKITAAMKMVAASRLRGAQTRAENSRGIWQPFTRLLGDCPDMDVPNDVTVAVSSDRGLCGGINSNIAKAVRGTMATLDTFETADKEKKIVIVGEKCRSLLQREYGANFVWSFVDTSKVPTTFTTVSLIADDILKTEYDTLRILYNKFKSAITFVPSMVTLNSVEVTEKRAETGGFLDKYEFDDDDRTATLKDIQEFQLACTLYNSMMENSCSELGSRVSAMDSSSKNAKEMKEKLTLLYNRSRQAAITTELIEIISGASALEG
mmetsp:Transcript_2671/g.3031  ORF Transcript_2671/g.3031 Transcript_2671/m.3031 type:complete len:323 (+) Transcript_2671:68-1036(+)|eukprot:CAMPEP_0197848018 /NCGR_PEP_ID=MMETSP1438-20131217/7792_1 /TAXON_ID=1461541 /ORGANISM="Pterosperma sp., Strain CCMP1384" /LENGTH=322 /DNA_ID=CAMNT_0043460133 /DNA_START=57 /DNA_END=1025 /DNA_ORIENTATION=+